MRHINGVNTQAFNRWHERVGHVFQGRFKAILVEKEAYLRGLCRYVVLNPLRAKLVNRAEDWPWSSYRATVGLTQVPAFLTTDWVLGQFGAKRRQAQTRYRRFVAEGIVSSPWKNLCDQIFLGSERFIEQVSGPGEDLKEVPRVQRQAVRPKLVEIFTNTSHDEGIAVAYREYGYTMKEIAEHLGAHYATVSRRLHKYE